MSKEERPDHRSDRDRESRLRRTRIILILALSGIMLSFSVLCVSTPSLQWRLSGIPARIYMLLMEYRRRHNPPAIPTPAWPTATRQSQVHPTSTPLPGRTPLSSPSTPPGEQPTPLGTLPTRSQPHESPTPTPLPLASPSPQPTLTMTTLPTPERVQVHLKEVKHIYQSYNNCGPATLAMVLDYYDQHVTQHKVQTAVRPNRWDVNAGPYELADYARSLGLRAWVREGGQRERIQQFLEHGIPVMLELWYYPDEHGGGHYRMLVGYDEKAREWIAYDVQLGPDYRISYAQQDREWQAFNRLYLVVYRPEQEDLVRRILGDETDDRVMYERTLAIAMKERDEEPDNVFAWFNLGTNYAALGRNEEAAAAYDQARILGLPFRMLWYQFGPFEAYLAVERYQDVIDLAQANLRMVGNQEESHYYLGRAQEALGNVDAARRAYHHALNYHRGYEPARKALDRLE